MKFFKSYKKEIILILITAIITALITYQFSQPTQQETSVHYGKYYVVDHFGVRCNFIASNDFRSSCDWAQAEEFKENYNNDIHAFDDFTFTRRIEDNIDCVTIRFFDKMAIQCRPLKSPAT